MSNDKTTELYIYRWHMQHKPTIFFFLMRGKCNNICIIFVNMCTICFEQQNSNKKSCVLREQNDIRRLWLIWFIFFSKLFLFFLLLFLVKLWKLFDQTCVNTCIDYIVTERTFSFFFTAIHFLNNVCRRIIYKTWQKNKLE